MPFRELIQNKVSVRMLWGITLIVGVFLFINTSQIVPNDFWWHMAYGREIVNTAHIPTVDVYSHTMAGQPYLSNQIFWLMDVWFYVWYSLGGPELVLFIHSLIITGTYLVIFILCWQNSRNWAATALSLFFAILLGIYTWNVRPQAISFLIGVIFLYAIYAYQRKPKFIWLLVFPFGMIVWVNSHGTYIIGIVLIGIWLFDEMWKIFAKRKFIGREAFKPLWAPAISFSLAIAVGLLNPLRFGIFSYLWTMLGNPINQQFILEWAPPSFDSPIGSLFFPALLFIALIFAVSPRRPNSFELILFTVFSFLAITTTRGVIWFALFTAPVLAHHSGEIISQYSRKKTEIKTRGGFWWLNFAILCFLILLSVAVLPWFRKSLPLVNRSEKVISEETPIQAVEYLLAKTSPGNLFNDMAFGSYLIWAAQPEYKVFVDPRVELYDPEIWYDYRIILRAEPGWDEKLEKYQVQTLMLDPIYQEPLILALEESDLWNMIYKDDAALIFKK